MFGKLLKDAVGIVGDVATVVAAPVAIALDVTAQATEPVADAARDVVEAVTPPKDDKDEE